MGDRIAITTSTFGQMDHSPLDLLEKSGFRLVRNTSGRVLADEDLIVLLKGCRGVIAGTERYNKENLSRLQDLKVISRLGVGCDAIDLNEVRERGIRLYTTPDGPTKAVAELVIGLVLSLLRRIPFLNAQMHKGTWQKSFGALFAQKRIGIIGLGQIGQEVARLTSALGGQVQFYDPYVVSDVYPSKDLEALLKESDILTMHVNYSRENHHLIGPKELDLLPKDAYVINCSRGGVVDEQALYEALKNQRLAGAAVDVFEQEPYQGPLAGLDNVILTPHIGAYAKEVRVKMEIDAVNNLIKGLQALNKR